MVAATSLFSGLDGFRLVDVVRGVGQVLPGRDRDSASNVSMSGLWNGVVVGEGDREKPWEAGEAGTVGNPLIRVSGLGRGPWCSRSWAA
jgi:hypothetical protein